MSLIIRLVKPLNILYNSLIIPKAIASLFLIILIIEVRLNRFYIKIKTNKLLII